MTDTGTDFDQPLPGMPEPPAPPPLHSQAPALGPIPVMVRRYGCPHCGRRRASKKATVEHIGRCWVNPDTQACKTCANYEPAVAGGCPGDPYCNCPDTPQNCTAGVDLPDFGGAMVTGCPKWTAATLTAEAGL